MPYVALQAMIDGGNGFGLRRYWSASYVEKLTRAMLADTVELAVNRASPMSNVILAPMGPAVDRVGQDETAFGHREGGFTTRSRNGLRPTTRISRGAKTLSAAVQQYATDGTYLNVGGDAGGPERTRFAFGDVATLGCQQ